MSSSDQVDGALKRAFVSNVKPDTLSRARDGGNSRWGDGDGSPAFISIKLEQAFSTWEKRSRGLDMAVPVFVLACFITGTHFLFSEVFISAEQKASRVLAPCSAFDAAGDDEELLMALQKRCKQEHCSELERAIEAADVERAFQASRELRELGGDDLCGAQEFHARATEWRSAVAAKASSSQETWCDEIPRLAEGMQPATNPGHRLILSSVDYEGSLLECTQVFATELTEATESASDWMRAREVHRSLLWFERRANRQALGAWDSEAMRVAGIRSEVCSAIAEMAGATHPDTIERLARDAHTEALNLPSAEFLSRRDERALARTFEQSKKDLTRCESRRTPRACTSHVTPPRLEWCMPSRLRRDSP